MREAGDEVREEMEGADHRAYRAREGVCFFSAFVGL